MSQFKTFEVPKASRYVLAQARVPRCLVTEPLPAATADADDAVLVDIEIADGTIRSIAPAAGTGRHRIFRVSTSADVTSGRPWSTSTPISTRATS